MLEKKFYANGQPVHEMAGKKLTYYYKNGKVKAQAQFISDQMEGEWIFYSETGQLWQIANFKNNKNMDPGYVMTEIIKLITMKNLKITRSYHEPQQIVFKFVIRE
jgi:hypothetical protein